MRAYLKSYAITAVGACIFALAFDAFFAPNTIAMGGVTGLAQVINAVFPALSIGLLTFLLNVPLFLLGWKFIGFHLLASSLFAMGVSAAAIDGLSLLFTFPPMDPMLATLCGGALMGLGVGMVFAQGATTGGTDVVARLLKLKLPWLPMGKLMLIPDFVVLTLVALAFGGAQPALYGLVALFVTTRVMDTVLYGLDVSKVAYIISDRWEEMSHALTGELNRGVTLLSAQGGYTGAEKHVLLVAFKQREIVGIKRMVHTLDADAFLIVCDAHEVLGEGFGGYKKEEI